MLKPMAVQRIALAGRCSSRKSTFAKRCTTRFGATGLTLGALY